MRSSEDMWRRDVKNRSGTSRPAHWFWVVACLGGFSLVFLGFAPSYFFRPWYRDIALPELLQLHGALMTSWFALFLTQVSLIARHRVNVHHRLGVVGAVLAGVIVIVGTITALRFLHNNLHNRPGFGPPAPEFFGFLIFDLYVFGGLVASAIFLRRYSDAHRRLMLLATLSIVSPGVIRIPFDHLSPIFAFLGSGGPGGLFSLDLLLLYVCVAYDTWRTRRLHSAFLIGGAFVAFGDSTLLGWLVHTDEWQHFAVSLAN